MASDAYTILYRPEVAEDLEELDRGELKRMLGAIKERLGSAPESYGKPLGGALKGLRRIRIGDFRVAYQVRGREVIIWIVMNRRDVYPELLQRFGNA